MRSREIRELPVSYEEWQIVYRQALQLDRALDGAPQLLEGTVQAEKVGTEGSLQEADVIPDPSNRAGTQALSMRALIAEIIGKATLLAKKEVQLAKVEVRADFDAEVSTVKGLAVSAMVVVLGLNTSLAGKILTATASAAAVTFAKKLLERGLDFALNMKRGRPRGLLRSLAGRGNGAGRRGAVARFCSG